MKKIAVPVSDHNLSAHFGLATSFIIYQVESNKIVSREIMKPPPHEPGAYPKWLKELKVTDILSEGIGQKALDNFKLFDIMVYTGVEQKPPDELIELFLKGSLPKHENFCDH